MPVLSIDRVNQLQCIDLVERVTDFLEGALSQGAAEQITSHLDGCRSCKNYLGEMETTVQLISQLPFEPWSEQSLEPQAGLLAEYRRWAAKGRS